MKVLLVAVNASYMHTNLAVRALKSYADEYFKRTNKNGCQSDSKLMSPQVSFVEYTINQPVGEVLRGIGFTNADLILFSTYIWNAEYVTKIIPDIKKILPDCKIGAGGPEYGYSPEKYFNMLPALDFIMFGEGEATFVELLEGKQFSDIKGIYYRTVENQHFALEVGKAPFSGVRPLITNLDELPFAYPEIPEGNFDPDHKIYYYESSRGCPFSCSYCLSSVDKSVRFKSLEKVYEELQIFLDANVALVKFVDRTYNLKPQRYIKIWEYILAHHNGKTMFHFEIEAEQLSEDALEFLQKVPEGVMQFEMGVQSANKKTLEAVNRSPNVEKLAANISRIPRTIHQHLDLIAGLPYENLKSFGESYDFVMNLRPDALQLGFLKVLSGTIMEDYAVKNGWKWMENPVYETFSTPYLSFEEIAYLKDIEVATDAFWNKGTFAKTCEYFFRFASPWKLISALTDFGRSRGAFLQARKESYWFELFYNFCDSDNINQFFSINVQLVKDLLRYDFVRSGKKGNYPAWYKHQYDKDKHRAMLEAKGLLQNSRIAFSTSEYEVFSFDVTSGKPEEHEGEFELLLEYK